MRRFVVPPGQWKSESVVITGEENHHLMRVLRHQPGDHILITDGRGAVFRCRLERVEEEASEAALVQPWVSGNEPAVHVTVGVGVVRGERFELALEKGVELGASRLVPLLCQRSVPRWDRARAEKKRARWQKVVRSAVKQCGREVEPGMELPRSLPDFVHDSSSSSVFLSPYDRTAGESLGQCLRNLPVPDTAIVAIGPEGGFTEEEACLLEGAGARLVSLGPLVLRSETAVAVTLGLMMEAWGELE